jgi:AcrR family transcriptional regulator
VPPAPDNPEDLRKWRLPRGRHGLSRELVTRSQRERLLAAVVRVTAAKGYEAVSVADILEQAGVGRQSFYELFNDKLDCLLAAHDLLVDDLEATAAVAFEGPQPWPERVRTALAAILEWFAANPEAARVTLIELATAGPHARDRFRSGFHRFTTMLDEGLEERGGAAADLPNITSLAAGTALARIYEETAKGRTAELPELLPELTFELLVPFVGEKAARETAHGTAG